jgi:hypothetical protein
MSIDRTAPTDGPSAAAPRSRVHDFTDRAEIRVLAGTVGAAFVLFGLLGFVPGITTHYGELAFAGQSSAAMLFGIFRVSILLNLVYLAFGVAGFLQSRSAVTARNYFVWGGAIFGVLWLYGLVIDQSGSSNLLAVNRVDNWWHLFLCLGLIATGVVMGRHTSSRSEDMAA